jgi:hypothetical protein
METEGSYTFQDLGCLSIGYEEYILLDCDQVVWQNMLMCEE